MPGAPLSLPEREEISLALIEDRATPWAVIGRRVERHPTTVMREVEATVVGAATAQPWPNGSLSGPGTECVPVAWRLPARCVTG